ncbi:hypothetical protein BDY19DRAFT_923997 [Irpex rosettiformis]|uniref:Uncharacterized protein n=1 Tax=Irpex rosettiformis TaxID=378272 RepID=A0ACB8UGU6_9APHY|nr:hypothetical protein BDY19DRAFT_923997 [Irpex rosettiformis]
MSRILRAKLPIYLAMVFVLMSSLTYVSSAPVQVDDSSIPPSGSLSLPFWNPGYKYGAFGAGAPRPEFSIAQYYGNFRDSRSVVSES